MIHPALAMMALCAAMPAAAAPHVVFVRDARVHARTVLLRDVAMLDALPTGLRAAAGALVVAHLPKRAVSFELPVARLADNARHGIPALQAWLSDYGDQAVRIDKDAEMPAPDLAIADHNNVCLESKEALRAHEAIIASNTTRVSCPTDRAELARVHYDAAAGVTRAVDDIPAGSALPYVAESTLAQFRKHAPVEVTMQIGHVQVRRNAFALQDGLAGRSAFVLAGERDVLPAHVPALSDTEQP